MLKLTPALRDMFGTHGQIPVKEMQSPLFIIGAMRSGTTFLVDLLTAHPQLIKIGSELNEIWNEIGGAEMIDRCGYKGSEEANGSYTYQMSNYFFRFIEESRSLKRHMMRANIRWSRKLGRITYDWENIIAVNKSPHLMNKVSYVHALFPASKFILIIRDIYAHSASMKAHFDNEYRKNSSRNFYPEDGASCWSTVREDKVAEELGKLRSYPSDFKLIPEMWIRLNRLALDSLGGMDRDQYIVIRYEDLILQQRETTAKLFAFLSLDPAHKKHEEAIEESTVRFKNTTTKGNPLDKWRKQLTEEEIRLIDDAIRENQEDYDQIRSRLDQVS